MQALNRDASHFRKCTQMFKYLNYFAKVFLCFQSHSRGLEPEGTSPRWRRDVWSAQLSDYKEGLLPADFIFAQESPLPSVQRCGQHANTHCLMIPYATLLHPAPHPSLTQTTPCHDTQIQHMGFQLPSPNTHSHTILTQWSLFTNPRPDQYGHSVAASSSLQH